MVVVRKKLCTKTLNYCLYSYDPFIYQRNFQLFISLVYIHPNANADIATHAMLITRQWLQGVAPDIPNFNMSFLICKVSWPLFRSVKGAFRSFGRVPLGMLDHSVVYLVPSYKYVLKRNKLQTVGSGLVEGIISLPPGLFSEYRLGLIHKGLWRPGWIVENCFCICILLWGFLHRKEISLNPYNKPRVTKSVKNIN